ncbi:MAG: pyridoxal phosphate-dependent aminotransferase [Planctomycetota bacterium]
MTPTPDRLIADRARAIDVSGIRRVFELGASLKNPINLSIGQPDFPVPERIKAAARDAIDADRNGYTLTTGMPELRARASESLKTDLGWEIATGDTGLLITTGTSGALTLAMLSLLGPGDEIIVPDPYFVAYGPMATVAGGRAVPCDTYATGFRMTAESVAPLITERTKAVLFNSPSNPAGVVANQDECRAMLELCRERGVVLISDEIYDEFTFSDFTTSHASGDPSIARCPSPAREPGAEDTVLLVRGFGKTYGVTGWRMGYCAGPTWLIDEMAKIQQYTFVCAPSIAQAGCAAAFDVDMRPIVESYRVRRDRVLSTLGPHTEIETPGGAFYAFPKVPERLGLTGTQFVERCIERGVLVIPGGVFSDRDTHFRLSFASPDEQLDRGLAILAELLAG